MIVVDSSVVLSLLFDEPESPLARRIFMQAAADDGAVAPPLQIYEILNACSRALVSQRLEPAEFDLVLGAFEFLRVRTLESPTIAATRRIAALAAMHNLSAYDAAYLESAISLRCGLATFDRRLRAAAEAVGVPLASG